MKEGDILIYKKDKFILNRILPSGRIEIGSIDDKNSFIGRYPIGLFRSLNEMRDEKINKIIKG